MKNINFKIKQINEQIKVLKARKAKLIKESSYDKYPEIRDCMEQVASMAADYISDAIRKSSRISDSTVAFAFTVADLTKKGKEFTFPEEIVDRVFDGDYPGFEEHFMQVAEEEGLEVDIDDLPNEVGALQEIGDEFLDDHETDFDTAVSMDGASSGSGDDMYSIDLGGYTSPYQYYWMCIWKAIK